MILERNPYYWKKDPRGNSLPYLATITFLFVPTEDAQVVKFQSGETHLLEQLNADNFTLLQRDAKAKGQCLQDLGPGLEFQFLVFNQNHLDSAKAPDLVAKQSWFRDLKFREAVSLAMDRKGMARLVYSGRATPIWGNVTPATSCGWIRIYPTRSVRSRKREKYSNRPAIPGIPGVRCWIHRNGLSLSRLWSALRIYSARNWRLLRKMT